MTNHLLSGIIIHVVAGMVELADTSVLEADAARREGSSPFTRTTLRQVNFNLLVFLMNLLQTIIKT